MTLTKLEFYFYLKNLLCHCGAIPRTYELYERIFQDLYSIYVNKEAINDNFFHIFERTP